MNLYLMIVLAILIGSYLLDLVVDILNVRHVDTELPEEFEGLYNEAKYKTSQEYLKVNTQFSIFSATVSMLITISFILAGGFNWVDRIARSFDFGSIPTGLIFAGLIMLGSQLIQIPFSIYDTFVIEDRFGFNKTTPKTFILDILKSWLLTVIIGGLVLAGILWFFESVGESAWLYCWLALSFFQIFLMFVAPVVIMPLFNKFVPLEDGSLKKAIEDYAGSQKFKLKGIFKMDGSKRSTKSNAYFTGFGKFRRIVLFDTLIEKHTEDELVSILAHEMGHYKKRHILISIAMSLLTTGVMFYVLSLFINNQGLFAAFKMNEISIYASLFFFGFLYAPIDMMLSVFSNIISRRHEYEADKYAVLTYKKPESMISALKKLSVENLSNLTPHPFKVFLSYSHPPVLVRVRAIKKAC